MCPRLVVAARPSQLSQAQWWELHALVAPTAPQWIWQPYWVSTRGDLDKKTFLQEMEKNDFFTDALDLALLRRECQAAIHSAKDLPETLRKGLVVAAITEGVDASDLLVLRTGLPRRIGVSSVRRIDAVRQLYPDVECAEIRGTIGERLQQMAAGLYDGVVMAKAALFRLRLLDQLDWIPLGGASAPLQGRLAVVVREGDAAMVELFAPFHHNDG